MQQIVIIALFFLLGGTTADEIHIEPFIFEDLINDTIESIRADIPDPLRIDTLTIELPNDLDILTGSANVSNFEITGLQSFQMTALNFQIIGAIFNFTINFPSVNVNSDYWADLLALELIPLYGNGRANIHITNGEIQGTAHVDLSGGISITNLRVQLAVGTVVFDIHGALDNEDFSEILSSILNDVVDSFVDNHQELISDVISPIIEAIVNAILHTPLPTTSPAPDTTTQATTSTPTLNPTSTTTQTSATIG